MCYFIFCYGSVNCFYSWYAVDIDRSVYVLHWLCVRSFHNILTQVLHYVQVIVMECETFSVTVYWHCSNLWFCCLIYIWRVQGENQWCHVFNILRKRKIKLWRLLLVTDREICCIYWMNIIVYSFVANLHQIPKDLRP